MIAHLRGTVLEKHPNQVIVDAAGVGYDVQIPVSTYTSLPEAGMAVSLHIHTHVREDVLSLFGFSTAIEKALFERLISVSRIGPKLAMALLSGRSAADLINAIRAGQAEQLRMPGVGKKTAELIVLELKDKLGGLGQPAQTVAQGAAPLRPALEQDVISALQNLGCSLADAEKALDKAKDRGAEQSFEPLFRAALARIR